MNFDNTLIWSRKTKCVLQVLYWSVGCMFTKTQLHSNIPVMTNYEKWGYGQCTLLGTLILKNAEGIPPEQMLKCNVLFNQRTLLMPPSLAFNAMQPVFRHTLLKSLITLWTENFSIFHLPSWTQWLSKSRPNIPFLFQSSWIFCFLFLSYIQELSLKSIICHYLWLPSWLSFFMAVLLSVRERCWMEKWLLFPSLRQHPQVEIYSWGYRHMYCPLLCSLNEHRHLKFLINFTSLVLILVPWSWLLTSDGKNPHQKTHLC